MSESFDSKQTDDRSRGHPTTRRGFITAAGFSVVSLYGLWAAYGAAPTSLSFVSAEAEEGAMAGMGHGAGGGMSPDEFRRLANEFFDAHALADGSVKPTRAVAAADHGGHHGDHFDEPVDVYVVASRYGYEPELLRLETGVPYRFRVMAVDADHGASINFRVASRMVRCRAKTLTETELRFTRPGKLMAYCTVFCGEGHDRMMGKIIVS